VEQVTHLSAVKFTALEDFAIILSRGNAGGDGAADSCCCEETFEDGHCEGVEGRSEQFCERQKEMRIFVARSRSEELGKSVTRLGVKSWHC
jgi:hypothetical protein